jgi:hypothetical protein
MTGVGAVERSPSIATRPPVWLVVATAALALAVLAMAIAETNLWMHYLIDAGESISLFGLLFVLGAGVYLYRVGRLAASLPLTLPWLLFPVITQGDQLIDNLSINWMRFVVHVLLAGEISQGCAEWFEIAPGRAQVGAITQGVLGWNQGRTDAASRSLGSIGVVFGATTDLTAAGIPIDVEPKTGLTGVEVVFTKLHAGGKFGGGSYTASGGLHGVGASVVNALSARLDVEVDRGGLTHVMSFRRGEPGIFADPGTSPYPHASFSPFFDQS